MLTIALRQYKFRPINMPMNMTLKIAILESGLSQIELSRATSIAEGRLSKIVNGHHDASDAERKVLAKALKRKVADLFPLAVAS